MTASAALAIAQDTAASDAMVTTQPSGKIAIVKQQADKFTCVVDGITIGTSKHKDYFEFHKRRGDIVSLKNIDIGKFVYVDEADQILETKKIDGAAPARASVARAIALAKEPKAAPVGFNNQTHAQAQENGRNGAQARLSGAEHPKADGSSAPSDQTQSGQPSAARATQATGTKVKNTRPAKAQTDKPVAQNALSPEETMERARENGRKGAQRAAELRA
jgi:hypothetical protein